MGTFKDDSTCELTGSITAGPSQSPESHIGGRLASLQAARAGRSLLCASNGELCGFTSSSVPPFGATSRKTKGVGACLDLDSAGSTAALLDYACDQSARSQVSRLCVLSTAGWHHWLSVFSSSVGVIVVNHIAVILLR